jgi:hypothetical protein
VLDETAVGRRLRLADSTCRHFFCRGGWIAAFGMLCDEFSHGTGLHSRSIIQQSTFAIRRSNSYKTWVGISDASFDRKVVTMTFEVVAVCASRMSFIAGIIYAVALEIP